MKTKEKPRVQAPGRRRLLLVLALLLGGTVLAAGTYLRRSPSPVPPEVTQSGLNPELTAAIADAREAVLHTPESAKAWGQLGMILLAHDFHVEAVVCFTQAELLDPRAPDWVYYHGAALSRTEMEEAVPKFVRAVELAGANSDAVRLRLAEELLALDRFDEAENYLSRVAQAQPGNPRAQLGLGRIAVRRGQGRQSLPFLERAKADPHARKAALALLAQAHLMLGEEGAAAQCQRDASAAPVDPPWPDPFMDRVWALQVGVNADIARSQNLLRNHEDQKAIALLEKSLRRYPDKPLLWFLLGKACFQTKKLPAAETALRKSLELEPASLESQFMLGLVLGEKGDRSAAKECFRATIALRADYALAHFNLGLCLYQEGDRKGAVEALRAAVQADPNFIKSRLALGEVLNMEGQSAEALDQYQQAVRLNPEDPEARKHLEELQKSKGARGG